MKELLRLGSLGCAGVGGWIAGIIFERKYKYFSNSEEQFKFNHVPGLPIFGTVSAASPFTESQTEVALSGNIVPYSKPSRISQVSTKFF